VAGLEDLEEVYLGLGPKGGVTNSEWELSTVRKGPENWGGDLGKLWELGGLKRTLEGLEGLRRTPDLLWEPHRLYTRQTLLGHQTRSQGVHVTVRSKP
jgi:hypothetical protein